MTNELKPTLANLKKTVRKEVDEPYARYIMRHVSIYFTWVVVRTPITANQVTLLQGILGIGGAICLGTGRPRTAVVGVILLQLGFVLDLVDGEVARWKNTQSITGFYLDQIGHVVVIPIFLFGLGFGVWNQTGYMEALICAFLSGLFILRLEEDTMLGVTDKFLHEAINSPARLENLRSQLSGLQVSADVTQTAYKPHQPLWATLFFRYPNSMNAVTILILLDLIIDPILIGMRTYPLTYFYVVLSAVLLTLGRMIRIWKVFKDRLSEKDLQFHLNLMERVKT